MVLLSLSKPEREPSTKHALQSSAGLTRPCALLRSQDLLLLICIAETWPKVSEPKRRPPDDEHRWHEANAGRRSRGGGFCIRTRRDGRATG